MQNLRGTGMKFTKQKHVHTPRRNGRFPTMATDMKYNLPWYIRLRYTYQRYSKWTRYNALLPLLDICLCQDSLAIMKQLSWYKSKWLSGYKSKRRDSHLVRTGHPNNYTKNLSKIVNIQKYSKIFKLYWTSKTIIQKDHIKFKFLK